MENNLNLIEILQNVPCGIKLYSTIHGDVYYNIIDRNNEYPIVVLHNGSNVYFTKEGRFLENCGECTLFPSKTNRNWETYKPAHQFKPFDKVLVRSKSTTVWYPDFYGKYEENNPRPHHCGTDYWKYCIPFEGNEHLLYSCDNE